MPIRPENRKRYSKLWKIWSFCIRADRAKWKCEWYGAEHGHPHPVTQSKVVLTVAHLDHTPETMDLKQLAALCQRCHNSYDTPVRGKDRRDRGYIENGGRLLFGEQKGGR